MRFATRSQIEAVFQENHELWGVPLSPEQYRDYWFSQFLTPWGASNLRYMALTEEEDGPLLSSLKLYRFTGRLHGEPVVIAGIGAVYTPSAVRTLGSASLLVSEVLEYMQKKKASLAMLYSDIGLPFYERLGFVPLPCSERSGPLEQGDLPPPRTVPGVEIRSAELADAKALAAYHVILTASDPLAIDRDPTYWEFVLFRRRRFWEMAPPGLGQVLSLIAVRAGRLVASGFAVAGPENLRIQEVGAVPGEEEALQAIVDQIWLAGARAGARAWSGRLRADAPSLDPRLAGEVRPAETAIPMAAPLGSVTSLTDLASDQRFFLWDLDHI